MSRMADLGHDLQTGEKSIDIVYRRRTWFLVSAVLALVSLLGLAVRQLNMGVEFDGGSVFEITAPNSSVEEVRDVVTGEGAEEPKVQKLGNDKYRIETTTVTTDEAAKITDALSKKFNVAPEDITTQVVGPSWGDDVTNKALTSLILLKDEEAMPRAELLLRRAREARELNGAKQALLWARKARDEAPDSREASELVRTLEREA